MTEAFCIHDNCVRAGQHMPGCEQWHLDAIYMTRDQTERHPEVDDNYFTEVASEIGLGKDTDVWPSWLEWDGKHWRRERHEYANGEVVGIVYDRLAGKQRLLVLI